MVGVHQWVVRNVAELRTLLWNRHFSDSTYKCFITHLVSCWHTQWKHRSFWIGITVILCIIICASIIWLICMIQTPNTSVQVHFPFTYRGTQLHNLFGLGHSGRYRGVVDARVTQSNLNESDSESRSLLDGGKTRDKLRWSPNEKLMLSLVLLSQLATATGEGINCQFKENLQNSSHKFKVFRNSVLKQYQLQSTGHASVNISI